MKYKKQAGGLKFEITVGLKTFEIGERTVENNWLTGTLTGRSAFAMFDELYYLNDVSTLILHGSSNPPNPTSIYLYMHLKKDNICQHLELTNPKIWNRTSKSHPT